MEHHTYLNTVMRGCNNNDIEQNYKGLLKSPMFELYLKTLCTTQARLKQLKLTS